MRKGGVTEDGDMDAQDEEGAGVTVDVRAQAGDSSGYGSEDGGTVPTGIR